MQLRMSTDRCLKFIKANGGDDDDDVNEITNSLREKKYNIFNSEEQKVHDEQRITTSRASEEATDLPSFVCKIVNILPKKQNSEHR